MDERTPSPKSFGLATPLRIGAVALAVRDLDRTIAFYRDVIGLDLIRREPSRAELGAGGAAILMLEHRLVSRFRRSYHFAARSERTSESKGH